MKKIYLLMASLLFVLTCAAQNNDYVTKSDFQNQNQKLSNRINDLRASTLQVRSKFATMEARLDSLTQLTLNLNSEKTNSTAKIVALEAKTQMLQEQLNETQLNVRKELIYLLTALGIATLVFLLLLFFLRKKTNNLNDELSDDIEKANEALNLHTQNNEEDLASLRDIVNNSIDEISRSQHEMRNQTDLQMRILNEQLKKIEMDFLAKISAVNTMITTESGQRIIDNELLNARLKDQKEHYELTASETVQALSNVEKEFRHSLRDIADRLAELRNESSRDKSELLKQLKELEAQVKKHLSAEHKE
jgi:hypothetical protein